MPYHRAVRYASPLLAWHELELTEAVPAWSDHYRPDSPRLMLPASHWIEAEQGGQRFVCDSLSPLWLTPALPYRMRQPFKGQRSVVLVFGGEHLPRRRLVLSPRALWMLTACRALLDAGAPDRLALEEAALALLQSEANDGVNDGVNAGADVDVGADAHAQHPTDPVAHRAVERARELLAGDPAADLSLHELAAAVASSPYHLARRFRRATGVSLHGYRTRLRMALALQRLAAGETQLVQLALELGYASHSHFSAAFRACHGVPPSRARELFVAAGRKSTRPPAFKPLRTISTAR